MSARIETAINKIDQIQQRLDSELDELTAVLKVQQLLLKDIHEKIKAHNDALRASIEEPK